MAEEIVAEKIAFPKKEIPNKIILIEGKAVELKPFLSISEQVGLINQYLGFYFDNPLVKTSMAYDIYGAEVNLILGILEACTNIDVDSLEIDLIEVSPIWNEVKDNLENYYEFRNKLTTAVSDKLRKMEMDRSVGFVLDELSKKVMDVLDKVSQVSPEEIERITKESRELVEKLDKSSVLSDTKRGRKSKA